MGRCDVLVKECVTATTAPHPLLDCGNESATMLLSKIETKRCQWTSLYLLETKDHPFKPMAALAAGGGVVTTKGR